MNKWLQFSVIGAVAFSIVFFIMIAKEESVANTTSELDMSSWVAPMRKTNLEALKKSFVGLNHPFKEKFFETLSLKGFFRGEDGGWNAIIESKNGESFPLQPGKKYREVELVSMDEKSCKLKWGSIEREVKLGE